MGTPRQNRIRMRALLFGIQDVVNGRKLWFFEKPLSVFVRSITSLLISVISLAIMELSVHACNFKVHLCLL